MNGGDVKASPRYPKESPRELKAQEGIERKAGLNPLLVVTHRCSDQRPEDEVDGAGAKEETLWQERFTNGMRANLFDEKRLLGSGKNP